MELVTSLFLGASLAACAGLRAFLPLLILGAAVRWELVPELRLAPGFAWIASDAALISFAVATALELAADKFPAVDHALDTLAVFLRPGAGALSVLAVLDTSHPLVAYTAAVILGTALTLPVHALRSATRVVSTTTTAGLANPALSLAEDVLAAGATLLALVLPVLAFALLALCLWGLGSLVRRRLAQRAI
ncbi:MAG TPA: DUF4126 domain-containing protein [Candidatus Nitrosotenuis sp.]|jgi:hypothetical protein|nr:DUF4126 domain-containing protein [Candidatus Nitrosotenuis sp.]